MHSELISEWTYLIPERFDPERKCSEVSVSKYVSDFDCDSDLKFHSFGFLSLGGVADVWVGVG